MGINSNLSKSFDLLRFPLAVMVVYLHIAPMFLIKDANPVYFWIHRSVFTICQCAVPSFFLISGYLLCANIPQLTFGTYLSKLAKRTKTLFIPYILWNLIALGYQMATHQIDETPSLSFIFLRPINFPLWFLRELIAAVIIFPLFYWFAKYSGKYGLLAAITFYLFNRTFVTLYFILSWQSIFFFYLGIYGGIHKIDIDSWKKPLRLTILAIALTSFIAVVYFPEFYHLQIWHLYLLTGTLSMIIIGNMVIEHWSVTLPTLLTTSTFFIFVAHKIGPTYVAKKIIDCLPMTDKLNEIVTFIVSPFLAVAICIGVYWLLNKYIPKTFKILTGGK